MSLLSLILYFITGLRDPGVLSTPYIQPVHHKQSSSIGSNQTGLPIPKANPSTNTSALLRNLNIESYNESNHEVDCSQQSYGDQFFQLSEPDAPKLQPIDLSATIIISKPIPCIPEPASPAIYSQEDVTERINSEAKSKESENFAHFCERCQRIQPLRARHCSTCNACIAMFDHHCPYIGTCIGEKNRMIFFWFVLTQTAECWVGFGICVAKCSPGEDVTDWAEDNLKYVLLGYFGMLLGILIGFLWTYHFYLALMNLTTWESLRWEKIDYMRGKSASPFDQGFKKNLRYYCSFQRQITEWRLP